MENFRHVNRVTTERERERSHCNYRKDHETACQDILHFNVNQLPLFSFQTQSVWLCVCVRLYLHVLMMMIFCSDFQLQHSIDRFTNVSQNDYEFFFVAIS